MACESDIRRREATNILWRVGKVALVRYGGNFAATTGHFVALGIFDAINFICIYAIVIAAIKYFVLS
jgi:hypothetical protein